MCMCVCVWGDRDIRAFFSIILIFNDVLYICTGSDVINSTFSPSVRDIFMTHSGDRMSKRLLSVQERSLFLPAVQIFKSDA